MEKINWQKMFATYCWMSWRRGFPKNGTNLANPDFAAYAGVCGANGIKVTEPGELKEALETALATRKPYIVDVEVNPDELILPPKLDAAHAWGYSLAS